jgi:DUF4097 and DUF4098 domain-containing protein YvlB
VRIDTHDGSVHAVTTNGSLSAERVSGPIELFSTNGRVMITDAFGPILAETTNGNAYVSTTPGNTGPIRIRTSNGRVDLDLGEGFEGILKCDTTNGKVQVSNLEQARLIESSNRSVELRVGNSDEISAVRTSRCVWASMPSEGDRDQSSSLLASTRALMASGKSNMLVSISS